VSPLKPAHRLRVLLDIDPSERRQWPRKTVLLSAVIADLNGENACNCMIRDMSAGGAQISLSRSLQKGEQIYLVDASNRAAHLAKVAWTDSDRAGLSFVRSYAINLGLPSRLKFFWRLLLEAKLKEVDRIVAAGVSMGLAFRSVGLANEHLHQMARHASGDEKFERLLFQAKRLMKM
jgi:PilZ domain-containing protein